MSAAHHSGIRLYRERPQSAASENPSVGIIHALVTRVGGIVINVKAVRIFHDELPGTHKPKTWPYFIPKFRLNLVEINRQLPVRADFS